MPAHTVPRDQVKEKLDVEIGSIDVEAGRAPWPHEGKELRDAPALLLGGRGLIGIIEVHDEAEPRRAAPMTGGRTAA